MGTLETFWDYVEAYPMSYLLVAGHNQVTIDSFEVQINHQNAWAEFVLLNSAVPFKATLSIQYLTTHIIKENDQYGKEIHRDVHVRGTGTVVLKREDIRAIRVTQSTMNRQVAYPDKYEYERHWIKVRIKSYTSENITTGKITTYSETNPTGAVPSSGCALTIGLMVIPMVVYLAGLLL